jgi:dienelactone hydrolase
MKRSMKMVVAALLLSAGAARAEIKTREIEYKHGDVTLLGYFAYDDAAGGKRPGVLVVHEWGGHNDYVRRRAEQLAKLGYAAFAIDMYGKGVQAKSVEESAKMAGVFKNDRQRMRARAAAGLDTLKKQSEVDTSRVAAMGYCFGGQVALELARSGADLAAVVSFHGALDTPTPQDAKNIKGSVLVLHGADDPFVPPEHVAAFQKEMRDAKVDWVLTQYGNAVHSFTNPDVDKANLNGAKYNAKADQRSWRAMQDFFGEIFGKQETRRAAP